MADGMEYILNCVKDFEFEKKSSIVECHSLEDIKNAPTKGHQRVIRVKGKFAGLSIYDSRLFEQRIEYSGLLELDSSELVYIKNYRQQKDLGKLNPFNQTRDLSLEKAILESGRIRPIIITGLFTELQNTYEITPIILRTEKPLITSPVL
ncbi:MAG: hypothetical protein WCK90_02980 [archaeon]